MSLFEAAQLSLIFGLLVFNAQPTVMYTIFSATVYVSRAIFLVAVRLSSSLKLNNILPYASISFSKLKFFMTIFASSSVN